MIIQGVGMRLFNVISGVVLIAGIVTFQGFAEEADGNGAVKKNELPAKQILFFMNPNGRPCQMQDAILEAMNDELKDVATVKYIRTTVREDYQLFREYGVRGLPMLIVVNGDGKIIKRFTPGIKKHEEILSALKK